MSEPTEAERVAALQAAAARDYARAQDPATKVAAREQATLARIHGNEQAGTPGGTR